MSITLSLRIFQDGVSTETINNEIAIKVRSKNFLRHLMATGAFARPNRIDRDVFVGKNPEPGVDRTDPPTRFVGVNDVATTQRIDQQVVRRLGEFGQSLLGTHQGGRRYVQVAVGVEKIGDLAIRNAEAMFEFGGHGQHDGTKGVARGTDGVGDLLDVARLMPLSATRTEATLDIELRDDWNDRRQVGLILHVDFRIDQFDVAGWTKSARNLDDAIDLCWRRRGPEVGLVSLASARLLAAFLEFGTAKDPRLPMRLAVCFVECAAQSLVVFFQACAPALQTSVFAFEAFAVLLQELDITIAQPTSTAISGRRQHGGPRENPTREKVDFEVCRRGALPSYATSQGPKQQFPTNSICRKLKAR